MFKTTLRTQRLFARVLLLALTLIGVTSSASALAEPRYWHEQHRDDRSYRDNQNYRDERGGEKRAMHDMVGEVEHNYRGHVVDVRPPVADEGMYRVRVLQEGGRVKTLRVPAKREHD